MLTLSDLLARAGISRHDEVLWFEVGKPGRATLEGTTLWFSDTACARFVANCWGPQLREQVPELTIKVRTVASKPAVEKPAKSKTWNKKGLEHMRRLGFE